MAGGPSQLQHCSIAGLQKGRKKEEGDPFDPSCNPAILPAILQFCNPTIHGMISIRSITSPSRIRSTTSRPLSTWANTVYS